MKIFLTIIIITEFKMNLFHIETFLHIRLSKRLNSIEWQLEIFIEQTRK